MSLLFEAGDRPAARDVERLLVTEAARPGAASISHRPDDAQGWLELLASGLTFDLAGLNPVEGAPVVAASQFFGSGTRPDPALVEAVSLAPGPHLVGGGAMIPLVRVMVGLAVTLALGLRARAVCWHPAATWMEPAFFARIVRDWLSGGPFPALGLTAVAPNAVSGVNSVGLAFFTGQELTLEAKPGEERVDAVKLAVRLIDYFVRTGTLHELVEVAGPDGENLLAQPSPDGRRITVWRKA